MKTINTDYQSNRALSQADEDAADEIWEALLEMLKEAQASGSKIIKTDDGVLFID